MKDVEKKCFFDKLKQFGCYLLIMIHQVEGILLIRIKCHNVSNSYETKSKSFVIGDDFRRVEAPTKRGDKK